MRPKILMHFSHRRATVGLSNKSLSSFLQKCEVKTILGKDEFNLFFGESLKLNDKKMSIFQVVAYYIQFYNHFFAFLETFDKDWLKANHLFKGVPHKLQKIIKLFKSLRILSLMAWIARQYLIFSNPYSKILPNFDLLISFTGIKDPSGDNLTRWAKKFNIPVLAVPVNWDNLSSKPFVEKPIDAEDHNQCCSGECFFEK